MGNESLTFAHVRRVNEARCREWHPGFPDDEAWTVADWSNAVCGEAGELANVVKKIRRYDCGLQGALDPPLEDLHAMAAEEIADVVLYLDLLAAKLGLKLEDVIPPKFNAVSARQGFAHALPTSGWDPSGVVDVLVGAERARSQGVYDDEQIERMTPVVKGLRAIARTP